MYRVLLILVLSLIWVYPARVSAVEQKQQPIGMTATGTSSSNSVSVTVSDQVSKNSPSGTPGPTPNLQYQEGNAFTLKGKITSISGDAFDIDGITVTKNQYKLPYTVSGNLELNKEFEVSGKVLDGTKYASLIKAVTPEVSSTPQPTAAPKISTPQTNLNSQNNTAPSSDNKTETPQNKLCHKLRLCRKAQKPQSLKL